MSRTRHHSKNHGPLAWGKGTKQRSAGGAFEYWSPRPGNGGSPTPGRRAKRLTHRLERRQGALECTDHLL